MKKRRIFSREFKLAAVKKIVEQGLSATEVARDLGIRSTLLHHWKRLFQVDGALQQETQGSATVEAELKRLGEEKRQIKMERDILKKLTAFFAKESRSESGSFRSIARSGLSKRSASSSR
jgi:transposase-like protein